MTKAEERKALDKIKKILAECGKDSYIGMAFNGCVELAESNIDNDFANDPKERLQTAVKACEDAMQKAADLQESYDTLKEMHQREVERLNERIELSEQEVIARTNDWLAERKAVTVKTADGEEETKPFATVKFINHNGFRFVNVVEESGWTTSYKIDELADLTIE